MSSSDMNRRDFHFLSMTAMGGAIAGLMAGCEKPATTTPTTPGAETSGTGTAGTAGPDSQVAATDDAGTEKGDFHLCRGLNECKGQGGGETAGKNACAGQGDCATVAHHACGAENECKGQGGCGDHPAANECKGQGGCSVPLMDHAWEKVRQRLAEKMKANGKELGPAPARKDA